MPKNLRLHRDCIFVQLDKPGDPERRSVVYNHALRTHFTPQNESARIVLDLLTRNAKENKGTKHDDIVNQLVQTFQVGQQEASEALDGFLGELRGHGLLEENLPDSDPLPTGISYPGPRREVRGRIAAGGTVICCGYTITWYGG